MTVLDCGVVCLCGGRINCNHLVAWDLSNWLPTCLLGKWKSGGNFGDNFHVKRRMLAGKVVKMVRTVNFTEA